MRLGFSSRYDSNLSSAVERAAGRVLPVSVARNPILLFVFVGADHSRASTLSATLLLREFESAFVFGCCAAA
jgi:hypothetical protein